MAKAPIFFSLFLLILNVDAQQVNNQVILHGTVRNFNNQVEVEDMSEMKDLSMSDPERFFIPDSTGHFKIRFHLNAPNYFRMGRNILYLSPGDDIEMFVDYKDPKIATFKGFHSHENEYLRETPFPKGGSFLNAGDNVRRTLDPTVYLIEQEATRRNRSLSSFVGLSSEFVKLEQARIRADILNSFWHIFTYYAYEYKLSKDSSTNLLKIWPEMIKPYNDRYNKNFIDPSFLKLAVYRDMVDDLIKTEAKETKEKIQIEEWMSASELARKIKTTSDRETKHSFQPKITAVKNDIYRKALQNTMDKVLQLSNGDPAVDFTVLDAQGNKQKLSSLKGKLIYLDLWATWCGPCLAEMPAYEKLKENFKDDDRIRFVSLSIDEDKLAWKTNMKIRNASGLQWIIDRTLLQAYNIISIPRSILIDSDFKIVDMSAPLPSSKTIAELLNSKLK